MSRKKKKIGLIFPHHLFEKNPVLDEVDEVVLLEEQLFFGVDEYVNMKMHKQKLVLHRATMKFYENFLKKRKIIKR